MGKFRETPQDNLEQQVKQMRYVHAAPNYTMGL
jgi:hypothetical protein